jgi:hypothetical protein
MRHSSPAFKASEYVTRVGNPRLEKPYESAALKQLVSEMIGDAAS